MSREGESEYGASAGADWLAIVYCVKEEVGSVGQLGQVLHWKENEVSFYQDLYST